MTALATTDDLGNLLGISIAVDDDKALAALDAASGMVRAYLGQEVSQVNDDVETLDGTGTTVLLLAQAPVSNVASVQVDGETLTADQYAYNAAGNLKRLNGYVWPAGVANVEVEYTHGYATIPDYIVSVVCMAAGRIYQTPLAVRQETVGSYSVTYTGNTGLIAAELDLLRRYGVR